LQFILENSIKNASESDGGELAGDWSIVDIDNWVRGSQFWAKYASVDPPADEE
jgi:hypothetical protein